MAFKLISNNKAINPKTNDRLELSLESRRETIAIMHDVINLDWPIWVIRRNGDRLFSFEWEEWAEIHSAFLRIVNAYTQKEIREVSD